MWPESSSYSIAKKLSIFILLCVLITTLIDWLIDWMVNQLLLSTKWAWRRVTLLMSATLLVTTAPNRHCTALYIHNYSHYMTYYLLPLLTRTHSPEPNRSVDCRGHCELNRVRHRIGQHLVCLAKKTTGQQGRYGDRRRLYATALKLSTWPPLCSCTSRIVQRGGRSSGSELSVGTKLPADSTQRAEHRGGVGTMVSEKRGSGAKLQNRQFCSPDIASALRPNFAHIAARRKTKGGWGGRPVRCSPWIRHWHCPRYRYPCSVCAAATGVWLVRLSFLILKSSNVFVQ